MAVVSVFDATNDQKVSFWDPIGVELEDGRKVYFHRASMKQLADLSDEDIKQIAGLLTHSIGGNCWASNPLFAVTIAAFERYCARRGIRVLIL
jgi:hypothetical protein